MLVVVLHEERGESRVFLLFDRFVSTSESLPRPVSRRPPNTELFATACIRFLVVRHLFC